MNYSKLTIVLICVFLTGNLYAQERAALINDHVAVFYPDHFQAASHLPSFALVEEPVEQGALPEDWPVKVEFSEAFGKSMAFIKTDRNNLV